MENSGLKHGTKPKTDNIPERSIFFEHKDQTAKQM
jgi:hypothetical protein